MGPWESLSATPGRAAGGVDRWPRSRHSSSSRCSRQRWPMGLCSRPVEPLLNGFFSSGPLARPHTGRASGAPAALSTDRSQAEALALSRAAQTGRSVRRESPWPKRRRPIALHLAPWSPHVAAIARPVSHDRGPKPVRLSSRRGSRSCPRPGRMRQSSLRHADASTRAWARRSRRTSRLQCASRRGTSSGRAPLHRSRSFIWKRSWGA
jgi:hypothetical protein